MSLFRSASVHFQFGVIEPTPVPKRIRLPGRRRPRGGSRQQWPMTAVKLAGWFRPEHACGMAHIWHVRIAIDFNPQCSCAHLPRLDSRRDLPASLRAVIDIRMGVAPLCNPGATRHPRPVTYRSRFVSSFRTREWSLSPAKGPYVAEPAKEPDMKAEEAKKIADQALEQLSDASAG